MDQEFFRPPWNFSL